MTTSGTVLKFIKKHAFALDTQHLAEYDIEYLDDERIIINKTSKRNRDIKWIWLFVFWINLYFFIAVHNVSSISYFITAFSIVFISLVIKNLHRFLPDKTLTFYRLKDQIAISSLISTNIYVHPYKQNIFTYTLHEKTNSIKYRLHLHDQRLLKRVITKRYYQQEHNQPAVDVSLDPLLNILIWYMDKNRPLPPGDAFDPYRQRDFERRKLKDFQLLYILVLSLHQKLLLSNKQNVINFGKKK